MLPLTEVASQSETFSKPALRKAKTNTVKSLNEMDGPAGHYVVVFFLDRPPLLAVRRRADGKRRLLLCFLWGICMMERASPFGGT